MPWCSYLAIAHAQSANSKAPTDCIIALSWFKLAVPAYGLGHAGQAS
ncbi:hypothetical protein [Methanolobus psychrotolerans]|nr:hypothetical protein [Methanolobus psychrotolerans]